jgi:hypothetical protein
MSFYLRKSLRAGPFRMNLSKSGVGVSVGVPGFRVGAGPRGNYVHMGSHGVYYRASLPSARRNSHARRPPSPIAHPPVPVPSPSDVVLEDVTGATTVLMAASSSSELLAQVQKAARAPRLWPWVGVAGLVLIGAFGQPAATVIVAIFTAAAMIWTLQQDKARRSVVVFYDVNDEAATHFQGLVDAFGRARSSQRAWHLLAQGAVRTAYQYKTNAGATQVIRRVDARLDLGGPAVLVTNIAVPSLQTPAPSIYFLPDRILVRERRTYAEATYASCNVHAEETQFIENGRVPQDSQQVRTTWRYVNVKGGPDRRFKDNRQLPVVCYGELTVDAPNGLHAIWQFSRPAAAADLANALERMRDQS